MNAREHRGAQIAERGKLREKRAGLWVVPSQTHAGSYIVDTSGVAPSCTCPDYEKTSAFCKHVYALLIYLKLHSVAPGPVPTTPKYTQNWSAYNAAQTNEKDEFLVLLHALCEGVTMPPQKGKGRPKTPLADLVFAATLKVYETTSGRRAMSDLRRAHELKLISKVPHYNSISRFLQSPKHTALLRELLQESASPLAGVERKWAIDSTGVATRTYDRWFDQKWGRHQRRARFVKVHAVCGTLTKIVPDVIVTEKGDATQFKPLLDSISGRFHVAEVSADKAYSSHANLAAANAIGAVPYIPFKSNTVGTGPDLWRRMFHYFQSQPADWAKHYHQRSNVEALFNMVKAKFCRFVRSKTKVAQENEVLCKFLCHNLVVLIHAIHDLGLDPSFWVASTAKGGQP